MLREFLFAFLVLLAVPALCLDRPALIIAEYDLDGAAADDDVIVAAAALADSTAYTVAASPDVPRPLIITVTDGDSSISAGTITITGTDEDGAALTHVFTFSGSGSTTDTTTGDNFATVTDVDTGALTGEGAGDEVKIGTTSTIPATYCAFKGQGNRNLGEWLTGARQIKSSGSSTSWTSSTASSGAFVGLAVGDLIRVAINGTAYERVVATYTDQDNIVVDAALDLTDGYGYTYKRKACGVGSAKGWFGVSPYEKTLITVTVEQETMTGGVVATVYCKQGSDWMGAISAGTNTFSSAGSWHLLLDDPWDECRLSLAVGTSDDATDTGTDKEIIHAYMRGVTF